MIPRITCSSRSVIARGTINSGTRQFHGSPIARETMGEKVKDLGHKVNMKVGKGLASAIDTGEKVTKATKETIEGAEQNMEEGKDYTAKKADHAAKGAQKAKEDMKEELNK